MCRLTLCVSSVFILAYLSSLCFCFFFFNDTATTEIYTLSLHDALPIYLVDGEPDLGGMGLVDAKVVEGLAHVEIGFPARSEEHTSELQSLTNLVCRLLLEKKK